METTQPFLSPATTESGLRCFVCWEIIKKGAKKTCVGDDGLAKFQEQAQLWAEIQIPLEVKEHSYTLVNSRLRERDSEEKIIVHSNCRTNFRTRVTVFENRYGTRHSDLMQMQEFDFIVDGVLQCEKGSDAELTVTYLRDVSLMLSLVAAVRESDIEKHLQAEQKLTCLSFAYDHQNYARYNSYQNVYLLHLKQSNHPAFQQLKIKGMGGSITGEKFSAIHGDLVTELFNKATKGTAGPFRSGFSTDIDSVNTWVNTTHIHTMLRTTLHKVLHMKTTSKHKEVTPRGKRLHSEHVRNLKNKLRGYGVDPFSTRFPKHISRGNKIDDAIVNDMLQAPELGMVQFKSFIEDRLVKGTVNFFSPIKRNKIKTGIKKEKKTPKAVEVLKEDCQAFGTIVSKSLTLEEAFQYPITSVPLSVSSPDGNLRQSEKASFRNYLIEASNATSKMIPKKAAWFVDGMAAVQTLKSKDTYGEWIEGLLRFITPPDAAESVLVGMVNDTYQNISAKSGTRKQRGEEFQRTSVEGFEQHMPSGIKWNEFLRNAENKEQLLELITRYVLTENRRQPIKTTFVITMGDKIYRLQGNNHDEVECNHEEADTRLVLLALEEQTDVVIVAKDTDVLVLLVWAYSQYHVRHKWYLKYDAEKYADIGVICDFFGSDICSACSACPAFHAITGCDTTSYFYRTGKLRIFKKVLADKTKLGLLESLGQDRKLTEDGINNVREFVRSVIYSGKDNEDYVETRIRLYKSLKNKSSMSLPPDPDSVVQVIKRAHCQAYVWFHCGQRIINHLDLEECGWKIGDGDVKPVWFVGNQFPPSVKSTRGRKARDGCSGDYDSCDSEERPPKKKGLKTGSKTEGKKENRLRRSAAEQASDIRCSRGQRDGRNTDYQQRRRRG